MPRFAEKLTAARAVWASIEPRLVAVTGRPIEADWE
jgi:hypothetical protein